jgi:hypothetical protein
LALPNVHLGIDPNSLLKTEKLGTKIGSFTADDINDAIDILADIVKKTSLQSARYTPFYARNANQL